VGHALKYRVRSERNILLLPANPQTPTPEETPGLRERLVQFAYTGRRKFGTVAVGFLVLVVGYHVVFGANGLTAYQAKRRQTIELAAHIEQLKTQNAKLASHNDRLQNDRGAIEQSIRANMHYAKPDEVIVTVQPPAPSPAK
jgi:cell division protein FtsB